jgi:hypothetical protein
MTAYIAESAVVAFVELRANAPLALDAVATIISNSGAGSLPFIVTAISRRRLGAQSGPPPRRPLEQLEILLGALGEFACAERADESMWWETSTNAAAITALFIVPPVVAL